MTRTDIRVVQNLSIVEPILLGAIEIQTVGAVKESSMAGALSHIL